MSDFTEHVLDVYQAFSDFGALITKFTVLDGDADTITTIQVSSVTHSIAFGYIEGWRPKHHPHAPTGRDRPIGELYEVTKISLKRRVYHRQKPNLNSTWSDWVYFHRRPDVTTEIMVGPRVYDVITNILNDYKALTG